MSSAKKNKEKNKISDDQVINLLGNYDNDNGQK